MKFLKVRRLDGGKFIFNLKSESSFELEEGFVEAWDLKNFKRVFIYKNQLITSYRIGPVDRSELEVVD